MKKFIFPLILLMCSLVISKGQPTLSEDSSTTPFGEERKNICDSLRPYTIDKYGAKGVKMPQPIVFKIDKLTIRNNYGYFQATHLFKNERNISTDYIMDIKLEFIIKKENNKWVVIYDLSRTDVPSKKEIQTIKNSIPTDFPYTVLSSFWKDLLK